MGRAFSEQSLFIFGITFQDHFEHLQRSFIMFLIDQTHGHIVEYWDLQFNLDMLLLII